MKCPQKNLPCMGLSKSKYRPLSRKSINLSTLSFSTVFSNWEPRNRKMAKGPFTRQKNGVRARGKGGTDRIILPVYRGNNLPRVGQKVGPRTKFGRLRLHYTFWGPDLFLIRYYGTAYAIGEIITQADMRLKKLFRTRVPPPPPSGFEAIDVYGPKPPKIARVRTHHRKT